MLSINGTGSRLFLVGPEPRCRPVDKLLWRLVRSRFVFAVLFVLTLALCPALCGTIAVHVDDANSLGGVSVIVTVIIASALVARTLLDSRTRWIKWHAWNTRMTRHIIAIRSQQ